MAVTRRGRRAVRHQTTCATFKKHTLLDSMKSERLGVEFGSCVGIRFYQKPNAGLYTPGLSARTLKYVGFIPKSSLRLLENI